MSSQKAKNVRDKSHIILLDCKQLEVDEMIDNYSLLCQL